MRVAAPLALLLLLPLASCDADAPTDAGPPGRREQVAALAALWRDVAPDSRRAGPCVARRLTRLHRAEELRDAGLLTDEWRAPAEMPRLAGALARSWVRAWFGCVDPIAVAARAQRRTSPGLDVPSFERCVRSAVTPRQVRQAALDDVTGKHTSKAVVRLSSALFRCGRQHR